jgi:hypothetical protein
MLNADPSSAPPAPPIIPRKLREADAIDIWIARWLGVPRRELICRYACDPRRLYEIWWEERFTGSRSKAEALFRERYPAIAGHVDYSRRRRIPHAAGAEGQLDLFELR